MAEEKEVLLEVKDLNVTYGSGRKAFAAVQNANFQIYKGETFGLVGESGSGKTTIGRAILRILPTSGGEILYKGQKINGKIPRALDKQITREIQMIFQDPQSFAGRGPAAGVCFPLSPRIFRRPAAAHWHCPGPHRGAGIHRGR